MLSSTRTILFIQIALSFLVVLIPGQKYSFVVFFSNFAIILASSIMLYLYEDRPFSFYKVFYIFSFFFFGIAPAIEYKFDVLHWGGTNYTDSNYATANLVILGLIFGYFFLYKICNRSSLRPLELMLYNKFKAYNYTSNNKLNITQSITLFVFASTSLLIVLWYKDFNLMSLLFRHVEGTTFELDTSNTSSFLIVERFIRPISFICLLIGIHFKANIKIIVVLAALALVGSFPTGLPRFAVASLYLPLILILFQIARTSNLFTMLIIWGLLLVFPFLNNFRDSSSEMDSYLGLNFDMFMTGHFDSYQSLMRVISDNIITNGKQLLGVIFFFVPRGIWIDKPIGSGAEISNRLGLIHSNISANYFAEGYINFGFIGIIIFLIIIAHGSARIDKIFWDTQPDNNLFTIFYVLSLGMFFFILRGDLLSSYAYTLGLFSSTLFICLGLSLARPTNR